MSKYIQIITMKLFDKESCRNMSNKDYYSSGMLSDRDVRRYLGKGINIFTSEKGELDFNLDKQLQLGSVDLRFRHEYKRFKLEENANILTYDMLKNHSYTQPFELKCGEKLSIHPGEIILTTSLETVQLSEEFAGLITGRSSIARLGIMVHCCQEYIKPGHGQSIPLQIINLSPYTVELDLSVPICQIIFFKLLTPASGKYIDGENAKYSNETIPQDSKIYEEMNESTNIIKKEDGKKLKLKKVKKYINPFIPSLIMLLLITPIVNNTVTNKTILDYIKILVNAPLSLIVGGGLFIFFIILNKGE